MSLGYKRMATTAAIGAAALAAIALTGCEASVKALSGREEISLADFADADAQPNVSRSAEEATTFIDSDADLDLDVAMEDEISPGGLIGASPSAVDSAPAAMANGTAERPANGSARSARPIIVDSLIGQVNGRPIFADAFFEPIEDQILAARAQMSVEEFVRTMEYIIADQLREVIFNELVLAEAETMITEDVRVGLRYWLKDEEEKRLAKSLGIRTRAESELAEEGLTLDQYLALRKDEAMIYTLVKKKIEPRVIVTWRDLEREYERRAAEFNPAASVTLAKIVLNREREAELVAQVETGIAEGKPFEEIGASLSRSSAYSEDTFELGPNGLADLPLNPAILEAIKSLEVGQTTKPVDVTLQGLPGEPERVTVYWYHIKTIDQQEARDLYDPEVQRQLYYEVQRRRTAEEQDRYLQSLRSKGIYDDEQEMLLRLRRIALIRYGR